MIAIQNCQHYNLFNSLYDLCRKDWEQWNQQHDIERESVNAGKVYRAETLDDKCGWWGVPVVHFYKKTKWSEQWPNTYKATKDIPGIIHVAVNFTKPGCTIPIHKDKIDRIDKEIVELIPTIIGINIPSDDMETVGFQVDEEKMYLAQGDILSFMPEEPHGSWSFSKDWRVTLYITTERKCWKL